MKIRVGIFGGSFDPVHIGHKKQCESYLASGLIDEIWVVPAYVPPHKSLSKLASYSDRLTMLKLAFINSEGVFVKDIESNLPVPNYTLKTLEFLKSTYPDIDFSLCIGSDSLAEFHTWYEYKRIIGNTQLLVAVRPGVDLSSIDPSILKKSILVDHIPIDISSSEIRKELARSGTSKGLDDSVLNYIIEHKLYL